MKKVFFLAAVAAMFTLSSCQKSEFAADVADGVDAFPVFTASISTEGTKTTIDGLKVEWEMNDEIVVVDSKSKEGGYKVKSIDGNGTATLTPFEVEDGFGTAPYTATYGKAPQTSQLYDSSNPTKVPLYMTAPSTDNGNFSFTVACGVLYIELQKSGLTVKSIAVTGTPTGGSETTYTLSCGDGCNVSSTKGCFYIALPAGSYSKIAVTNSSNETKTLTTGDTKLEIINNQKKTLTSISNKLHFTPSYPGSSASPILVGSLWWAPVNCGATNVGDYGLYYQWGRKYGQIYDATDEDYYVKGTVSRESDGYYQNSHVKVSSGSWYSNSNSNDTWEGAYNPCPDGWRVPSKDELTSLFTQDSDQKWKPTDLPIFPFAGTNSSSGYGDEQGDYGYYWSSTLYDSTNPYYLKIRGDGDIHINHDHGNAYGRSVRCVKTAN